MNKNKDILFRHTKPKFCIGLTEIANVGATYARALKKLGYQVTTVMHSKNPYFLNEKYDVVFSENRWFQTRESIIHKLAWQWKCSIVGTKCILTHDIFLFIFRTSFFPYFFDFPLIKALGKKIVTVFLGCDIRHWSSCEEEYSKLGFKAPCVDCDKHSICRLEKRLRVIRAAEKYSDLILSVPSQSQLLTRAYRHSWVPLELNRYQFCISDNPIPKIVHAPTSRTVKGTKYILEALNRLEQEGFSFDLILLEKKQNQEVLTILSQADIVVDQLFSVGPATLCLESLASGNAVLAGCKPEYQNLPSDCPVIDTGPENVYDNLKKLLENRGLRIHLAQAGRQYVENYHDYIKVMRQILEWLNVD